MPVSLRTALSVLCLIVLLQHSESRGQETPAVTIDTAGSYGGGNAINVTRGWEFTVERTTAVTSLGMWDYKEDGLESDVPVGLWDTGGNLIASVVIPSGTRAKLVNGFRCVPVTSQWLLRGEKFVIGAAITPGTEMRSVGGSSNLTFYTDGAIRWTGNRYILNQNALAFPEKTSQSPGGHIIPSGFGASLMLEDPTHTRRFYRNLLIATKPFQYRFLAPLEQADGSHKADPLIDVTLFAATNGTLTQVVLNGQPIGTGAAGLDALKASLPGLVEKWNNVLGVAPRFRIAALSWGRPADTTTVADICRSHGLSPQINPRAEQQTGIVTFREARTTVDGAAGQRFVDRGDFVEDGWTGLLWQKHGKESGKLNFDQAHAYAEKLTLGDHSNWRLPTIEEMATLFPALDPVFQETPYTAERCCAPPYEDASYWTSERDDRRENTAYVYHWYAQGGPNNCLANANYVYVRCVHAPLEPRDTE